MINPELVKLARLAVGGRDKIAFQPPGGGQDPSMGMDPSMGGGMPMDPSMGGGMPMDPSMGGMPPMDPSMGGGGMPPMDPSMGGGIPPADPAAGGGVPMPGASGLTADSIRQIMQETLGQLGVVPGQPGPGGTAAGGKPGKPDLMAMSMDLFQLKKMVSTIMNVMDIPMPQDILDGPNRDPSTGAPMMPGQPGSTSDPTRVSPPVGGGAGGGDGAIKPMAPIQGAFGGGGEKSGATRIGTQGPKRQQPAKQSSVSDKAAALVTLLKKKARMS